MERMQLRAVKVCNEINLNDLANHFGITKKFKWEDILVLDAGNLKGIIKQVEKKSVHLFYFGSVVFVNMEVHEINDVLNYLKSIEKTISLRYGYIEEYEIEINPNRDVEISNDLMRIQKYRKPVAEITATVIARSVSLKKMEAEMDQVFDKVESIITFLNRGKFNMSDKELAKMSSSILGFKYNMVSYIMLLDKPQITWEDPEIEEVFQGLAKIFELGERYEKIKHKTETLLDVTEVFATISHANRASILEWIVIIFFAIDIVMLFLTDVFKLF